MAAVRQALAGFNNSMCKRFQAGLKNRQVVCQQFVVASRDLSDLINVNRPETDRGYVETPVLRRTLCARFDGLFDALRQTRCPLVLLSFAPGNQDTNSSCAIPARSARD